MIIEYSSQYEEAVKDLLIELQEYIVRIDKEGYNNLTDDYRDKYFKKTIKETEKYEGKMFLYEENGKIVGLVVGVINNDEIDTYDFKAPKRGRVTELIVSKDYRGKNCGKLLLKKVEDYLIECGCKDILIGVFGYNDLAIHFYEKNGYHTRMIEMTKKF